MSGNIIGNRDWHDFLIEKERKKTYTITTDVYSISSASDIV